MADAGFTHAAGADIPHSATSRRGMLPALAGLTVGLAYATISVYWAVGGRWPLNTVGISLSQPGQAGHLAALLAVWGAAAVKAVAALLPLLAIGVWPRTANGGLRRLARVLTWIEAAILVGYGLVLTASGLLVQAGVIKAAAHADRLALKWHAYLWDPWFLIWGVTEPDAAQLAVKAAGFVADRIRSAVAAHGAFTCAVSGGQTPGSC